MLRHGFYLSSKNVFANKPRVIVATPAKNEAERLPAYLQALEAQTDPEGHPLPRGTFAVILLINNSGDDSAAIACRLAQDSVIEIRIVEAKLAPDHAHAGGARRAAMDLAAASLADLPQSVIMTTDADSRATPTWIAANLRAFADGADAVLGTIALDEDGRHLPAMLHRRGALESAYEQLLTELAAHLDPEACNPWPHHATISGASLAVTRDMYLRAGRLPRVPLGEDKAFVAALRRCDARIRFSTEAHVITSGRTVGRAPGGVADTLRLRSHDAAALCDEALEPVATAFRRMLWRGRLRRDGLGGERWPATLAVPPQAARQARAAPTFGRAWEIIERTSLRLQRHCLGPVDLPRQIAIAERLLRVFRFQPAAFDLEQLIDLLPELNDSGKEGLALT